MSHGYDPVPLVAALSQAHEEVAYIIEELFLGYAGDAKAGLAELIDQVEKMPELGPDGRTAIAGSIRTVLGLLSKGDTQLAHQRLIELRRRIRNTIFDFRGEDAPYPAMGLV